MSWSSRNVHQSVVPLKFLGFAPASFRFSVAAHVLELLHNVVEFKNFLLRMGASAAWNSLFLPNVNDGSQLLAPGTMSWMVRKPLAADRSDWDSGNTCFPHHYWIQNSSQIGSHSFLPATSQGEKVANL